MKQRGRRVADGDHCAREPVASTAPARRRSAWCRVSSASAGTRGSRSVQITSLPAGSRARVMPCATISELHRIGAPAAQRRARRRRRGRCRTRCDGPHRCCRRHGPCAPRYRPRPRRKRDRSVSARMMANERSVDRVAVADVVVAAVHRRCSVGRAAAPSCSAERRPAPSRQRAVRRIRRSARRGRTRPPARAPDARSPWRSRTHG